MAIHFALMRRKGNRRLSKRRWTMLAAVGVVALLVMLDSRGLLLVPAIDDVASYHGRVVLVTRVIDGDTIEIDLPDVLEERARTRVRLWGIDSPELADADSPPQPLARESLDMARSLAEGMRVTLRLEPHQTRDKYDRLLAHVELPDARLLSREMLVAGLARADDRWPHGRLQQYAQAELIARRAKVGLWSE